MSKILSILLILAVAASFLSATETGGASWYGGKFQGRITANGEVFDTNKFTAAHKTLPFNTVVEVTNLDNGKTVLVRINDRGPFVKGRIIDLSRAAAEKIGLVGQGVGHVKLRIIKDSKELETLLDGSTLPGLIPSEPEITFQVASFSVLDNAEALVKELKNSGLPAEIEKTPGNYYRVVLKNIRKKDVEPTKDLLKEIGYSDILIIGL